MDDINYTFLNYYMSALRNMIFTSSMSITIVGLSDKFIDKEFQVIFKIISFVILIFSVALGYKATTDYNDIIDDYIQKKEYDEDKQKIMKHLKVWSFYGYGYLVLISLLAIIFLYKFIKINYIKKNN